jgi:type IV fimbrial biogenesis protein FimT
MNSAIRPFKQAGFTLIELMVTVSMVAILASLAAPGFREIIAAQRMRTAAFGLMSDLTLARSEAVKRGASVSVAPVGDGWAGGWRVAIVGDSVTLNEQKDIGQGLDFTTGVTSVVFDRNGRLATPATVRFQIALLPARYRCISLDPSGRPKSTVSECPT